MRTGTRKVTVIVQPDGALAARSFRLPLWALRAAIGGATGLVAFLVLMAVLWAPVARTAARVPGLERQVKRLEADNAKIRELAAALDSVQARYEQVRSMLGGEIVPAVAQVSAQLMVAPAVRARPAGPERYPAGPSRPAFWPLDDAGYVTRGTVGPGAQAGEEPHEGLDIAVAPGSVVRAAGGGTVVDAGDDPEYGHFVRIQHPEDYVSLYGHLSRILAKKGAVVEPGEVIGLSGNTGRSSAPHLHLEVRQQGKPVDPLTLIKQEG